MQSQSDEVWRAADLQPSTSGQKICFAWVIQQNLELKQGKFLTTHQQSKGDLK
jgi:hypothetical protein